MATVGNLFVNIKGNTSGLERSLKKARKKLSFFKHFSDAATASRDVEKFKQRQAAILRDPQAFGSTMQRFTPGFKKAQAGRASASAALSTARMGMFVGAAFATIGVSLAAAAAVMRAGAKVQAQTEADFQMFTAEGAMENVRKLMDRIAYVQRPEVRRRQQDLAEQERYAAHYEREAYGGYGTFGKEIKIGLRELGARFTLMMDGKTDREYGDF
ncbi:hypothetical protein [Herbaspirillum sp.]|uniref:hypothetical protein n=1 Tax=Herbaspirillum sp. TaxID=1890675 RepID=UPI000C106506|nr:hypothetical protein [Herbaspirillum sp.]MBO18881.1 hypothetical protein [Herbaspirillum sp.]|tara:strand:+ start:464 stop:1105 length:642 start_codon:yes stop_codon:yes gene_type:complete